MDEFEKELKEDFLKEASELLDEAEQYFLDLEQSNEMENTLDSIFRFAHNLKGTSRAVGFGEMAEFTHEFENLILRLKQKELQISSGVISLLLACNDHVRNMVTGLKQDLGAQFDSAGLIERLKNPEALSEEASFGLDDVQKAIELVEIQESNEVSKEPCSDPVEESFTPSGQPPQKRALPKANADEDIRVALSKIETLNNFVGELVLLQTVLGQRRHVGIQDKLANKSITQLAKITKEIQDIAMSMRLVSLKPTLQKMKRIIRDTSQALGKKVELYLEGEDTEIDKTVLDLIVDPLVHMVRNAVDHGVEMPADRLEKGKSETGSVTIASYHRGNRLIIEIRDDGKGMDPAVLKKKAVEKGILKDVSQISDEQALDLIFHPGFSTKDAVSEISGRGVGMDVVRTNIHQLSGDIGLKSKLGQGTVCTISLPITLAIIEGMVVRVGEEKFILPLTQVLEFTKVKDTQIHATQGGREFIHIREDVLPLFFLSSSYSIQTIPDLDKKICVICQGTQCNFAVMVDELINQQQIVIKDVGPEIRNRKGIMGSSILGDGKAYFIIDFDELYKEQMRTRNDNLKISEAVGA